MFLGAIAGGLGATTVGAQAKTPSAAQITAARKKIAAKNKQVDQAIDKIAISNAFALTAMYTSGADATHTVESQNLYQTYKLTKPLIVSNEFRHKTVTLPKGAVVTGDADGQGNLSTVDNTTLSLPNQKRIAKLGNWHRSYTMVKNNGAAVKPYTRHTAFSYHALASIPDLSVKTQKAQFDGATSSLPFISVTADSQLTYHKTGQTFKATRYAKIKSFKRTHTTLTYYLNKPIKGINAKKTKVGHIYRYKVNFKLGHVFQSRDSYNGDAGAYNLTITNGKQAFFFPVSMVADSFIDTITGNNDVATNDKQLSKDYVESLY